MMRLLWLALVTLATASGSWVYDAESILEPITQSDLQAYYLYVGKWSACNPDLQEPKETGERSTVHIRRSYTKAPTTSATTFTTTTSRLPHKPRLEDSPVVYTPQLGTQRRELECRAKADHRTVDSIYCGNAELYVGTTRTCLVRRHCELGAWLPWRDRADGAEMRARRIRVLQQGGGMPCPVVQEVSPMAQEETAHWFPGPWGPCRVGVDPPATSAPARDIANYEYDDDTLGDWREKEESCGGGIQWRQATCARADGKKLHPAQCAHATMPTLVQPCEVPCPRDCEVGEWGEWGACQPTDGCPLYPVQQLTTTGYSVRRRRVISAASGGGAPCPPLEEKRTCSTPRCASWQALPWGSCVLSEPHTACGPGRRSRQLRCVGQDGREAQRTWCSGTAAPARTERCRIACAGDCVVSAWSGWSPCSASCAVPHPRPTTVRRRHILAHAAPDGWPCPPEDQLIQNETCNTHACASYSWLATPWGPCEPRPDYQPDTNYTALSDGDPLSDSFEDEPCVEEGEMTRDVMCVQNNADVVREVLCAPLRRPATRRACTLRCRRGGCRVEAWKPWSACPNSCEPSKQVRIRNVIGGPNCGALKETRRCPVPKTCRPRETMWITGQWSSCRLPSDQGCGLGYRIRSIWCERQLKRTEAGACAGQRMPRSVAPCNVLCNLFERPTPTPTCQLICAEPLKYLDAVDPELPLCACSNVTLDFMPADSDCILPPGAECGEGRALRAARCLVNKTLEVPMDVCRKYHPLSGRKELVKSYEGYRYDEEFPALLRSACSVPCARDCAMDVWGEWGPCAAELGTRDAFRMRTREVLEGPTNGGRMCGATLQRAACSSPQPHWATGEWTACAPTRALCGRALINRTVTCIDAGGKRMDDSACEAAFAGPAPSREEPCRAPCPADCVVSTWSDWSPCEQTKRGGRRDRTRVVLRPAAEGGNECPHLVEGEPCVPHVHSWHIAPWADCQPLGGSDCGEGIKRRTVRCLRSDGVFVNDSFCVNRSVAEAQESWCYVPCGVDCRLGEWGPWDTSSCQCGVSITRQAGCHMRRTRQSLSETVWPGRACPPTEQRAPCPRVPCMRLVARPLLGCHIQTVSGGETDLACGWGVKRSHVRCELVVDDNVTTAFLEPWRCAPILPGRLVEPLLPYREEEECQVECGCKGLELGQPGPWGPWGDCLRGVRTRSRQMVMPPSVACRDSSTRYVTIEWANCTGYKNEVRDLLAAEPRDRTAIKSHDKRPLIELQERLVVKPEERNDVETRDDKPVARLGEELLAVREETLVIPSRDEILAGEPRMEESEVQLRDENSAVDTKDTSIEPQDELLAVDIAAPETRDVSTTVKPHDESQKEKADVKHPEIVVEKFPLWKPSSDGSNRAAFFEYNRPPTFTIEASPSVLALLWITTIILGLYAVFLLLRGYFRFPVNRKVATVTKV